MKFASLLTVPLVILLISIAACGSSVNSSTKTNTSQAQTPGLESANQANQAPQEQNATVSQS